MLRKALSIPPIAAICFSTVQGQSSDYPLCDSGYESIIGSGRCTGLNNNRECGWDGGDCCECDCVDAALQCGSGGYDCLDPDSLCFKGATASNDAYDVYDDEDDYPLCDGDPSTIGGGACIAGNNNEDCGWDGGDCCECDCFSTSLNCGILGYDCQDPTSTCYEGDGAVNGADEAFAGVSDDGQADDDDFTLGIILGCAAGAVLLLGAIVGCVLFKTGRLEARSSCCDSEPAAAADTRNTVHAPHSAPSAPPLPPPAYASPLRVSSAVDKGSDTTGAPSVSSHPLPPPPVDPSPPPPAYGEPSSGPAPIIAPHHETIEGPPAASAPPPPPPAFSDYYHTLPPSYQE
ncbi:unnamed protein product [Scytosiphon promiscuus]